MDHPNGDRFDSANSPVAILLYGSHMASLDINRGANIFGSHFEHGSESIISSVANGSVWSGN